MKILGIVCTLVAIVLLVVGGPLVAIVLFLSFAGAPEDGTTLPFVLGWLLLTGGFFWLGRFLRRSAGVRSSIEKIQAAPTSQPPIGDP